MLAHLTTLSVPVLFGAMLFTACPADACTFAIPEPGPLMPIDGAVGVPTNALLFIRSCGEEGVLRAEDGSRRQLPLGALAELAFFDPGEMQPSTRFTVELCGTEYSFTTGETADTEPPRFPDGARASVGLTHYETQSDGGNCNSALGLKVRLDFPPATDNHEVLAYAEGSRLEGFRNARLHEDRVMENGLAFEWVEAGVVPTLGFYAFTPIDVAGNSGEPLRVFMLGGCTCDATHRSNRGAGAGAAVLAALAWLGVRRRRR